MYTRQKKDQVKIGYGGYGGFGQVPQSTTTVTVAGQKLTLTGPAHEIGPATAVVSLLNAAVTGAQKGQLFEAQTAITNAKNMLPATGSLRSKLEPLVTAAQSEVSKAGAANPAGLAPSPGYNPYEAPGIEGMLARWGIPPIFAIGGAGAFILLVVFLAKR